MIKVYENTQYDALYLSDDCDLACRIIDLSDELFGMDVAQIEFRRVVEPTSLKEWRLFFKAMDIKEMLNELKKKTNGDRETYRRRRKITMAAELLNYGLSDPYWPFHYSDPDMFIWVHPDDRRYIERNAYWVKFDRRFNSWEEVMKYIEKVLDA